MSNNKDYKNLVGWLSGTEEDRKVGKLLAQSNTQGGWNNMTDEQKQEELENGAGITLDFVIQNVLGNVALVKGTKYVPDNEGGNLNEEYKDMAKRMVAQIVTDLLKYI